MNELLNTQANESLFRFNSMEDFLSSSCEMPEELAQASVDHLCQLELLFCANNVLLEAVELDLYEEVIWDTYY